MIGIYVSDLTFSSHIDIVKGPQIFDVTATIVTVENQVPSFNDIELEQCTL